MANGIKKVKYVLGKIFPSKSVPNQRITIAPDKEVYFDAEWDTGTPVLDTEKPVTWFVQSTDRINTIDSETIPFSTRYFSFKMERALCGSYYYFIDANLSGKANSNNSVGLYVNGYCSPKIIITKWSIENDGEDIRKTHHFSYGDVINLSVETEGLNGDFVDLELYRRVQHGGGLKDDVHFMTYIDALVIDGEINVSFNDTYSWMISNAGKVEFFYIQIKTKAGVYVSDGKSIVHATYLRIKNKISNTQGEKSTNNTPVKIGKTDKSAERISFAAVYFRPLDTWNGEFGFDWLREDDNGLKHSSPADPDPAYANIIEGGYLDGINDLTGGATGTAYAQLKNQYERLPMANTGYAVTEYFVPYLTLFPKSFVDTLPATVAVKPKYEADLHVFLSIKDVIDRLEFEYDKNSLIVSSNTLSDKTKTNSLVISADTSIKVTCKIDLHVDKEIKIYCYRTNGQPRSLAGKIIVVKNDASARKNQKFVLVPVNTNIDGRTPKNGKFSPSEQKSLQEALYQSIITSTLELGPILDLSNDPKFQILTDVHGNKTYGDYIFKNTLGNPQRADGKIFQDHIGVYSFLQNLYFRQNNQYNGYFTIFCFDENSYYSYVDPLTGDAAAVVGQVENIRTKNVFLFNGPRGSARGNDTMAHEGLHGLGLYHTHSDNTRYSILEPDRKYVFANGNDRGSLAKSTNNIMSYGNKTKKTTWQWQWEIIRKKV